MVYPVNYSNNVFVNCPFDDSYNELFEAIIFTVRDCGFIARCAKEEDDAGNVRIIKIMKIIDECKYGIHDISKADLDENTRLARFNMPLELGLFLGAHKFADNYNKEKRTLIMDIEPFRYRNFISDISGQDIKAHNLKKRNLIRNVRDFLLSSSQRLTIPGPDYISGRFERFINELPDICKRMRRERDRLTFLEYSTSVSEWIIENMIE